MFSSFADGGMQTLAKKFSHNWGNRMLSKAMIFIIALWWVTTADFIILILPPPQKKIWKQDIWVEFLPQGETINAAQYLHILQKICHALHDTTQKENYHATPQHVNHTARLGVERIQKNNSELFPHPPYNLDNLAPSDYHQFGFGFIKRSDKGPALCDQWWSLWSHYCSCIAEMEFFLHSIFKCLE